MELRQTMTVYRRAVVAAVITATSFTSIAAQQTSEINLRVGDYVLAGVPCKDAPFAAMREWDGRGFGTPHETRCSAHVVGRDTSGLLIENICTANGDGSPAPTSRQKLSLTIIGKNAFTFAPAPGERPFAPVTYRRCKSTNP